MAQLQHQIQEEVSKAEKQDELEQFKNLKQQLFEMLNRSKKSQHNTSSNFNSIS